MTELHVLRVFCGDDGSAGNPLGVFLDGGSIAEADRQATAADLGFSETVFVDDAERGEIRIFTPAVELPFAGHPVVGTAWLLTRERDPVAVLRPPAGEVPVRAEAELTYAAGRPEWAPGIGFLEVDSPEEVEALDGPPEGVDPEVGVWAWIDEGAGVIRERVFAPGYGIPEDEATGSAAISLAAQLGRELDIRQGRGSRILARPLGDGMVEIAGRVELDGVRDYPDPGRATRREVN
jgi:predicted PhzF superfamily epimerase YddE/YHI9